jgi:hypothetical protein
VAVVVAIATVAVLALATVASAAPTEAAADEEGDPALFHVGAATRSVVPPDPARATHVGGFGTCEGCPTTDVREGDPLSARAFVVADDDRSSAVAVAVVDNQGWFAGYDDGPGLGITDLRTEVADELARPEAEGGLGVDMGPEDVIVQTTHCHSCPDVTGIFGELNPDYLRFQYEQTRDAILDAARSAEPAHLEVATGDIAFLNNVVTGQPNSYEGWPKDGQLPILHASHADTGEPVGTYVQVPTHENIVFAPRSTEMATGYFGPAARWIEAELGGTAVVGPGTLGDQVSPMQGSGGPPGVYETVDRVGGLVGAQATAALEADGRPVQDGTVDGAEQHLVVPLTNPALLAGACTPAGAAIGLEIERSCQPPYAYAGAVGTWATALRVGDVAIASEPGEAFPHVSSAIRDTVEGAETVMTAGQAQDQLGYYYEPWALPFTFVYSVNHYLFNVGPTLAEENVQAHAANAALLGFETVPTPADPVGVDLTRTREAGVQVVPFPNPLGVEDPSPEGDPVTVPVGVFTEDARLGDEEDGEVHLDFGDGTPTETRVDRWGTHTFPEPGTYDLQATMPSADASWSITVHVEGPHDVHATWDGRAADDQPGLAPIPGALADALPGDARSTRAATPSAADPVAANPTPWTGPAAELAGR